MMQNKQFMIVDEDKGKRLDVFLMSKFPEFTRSHIKNMIQNSKVTVNGKVCKAGEILKNNMSVSVEIVEPEKISTAAEDIDFEIVYQDEDLVVVNKPQGLVVHPCSSTKKGTLVNGLLFKIKDLSGINGQIRPGIVHRLDKDTSGLLVVAKNDRAHVNLAEQIKNKVCKRNYLAVVEGILREKSGQITTYLKRDNKDRKKMSVQESGRLAITDFQVLKYYEKCCLVEFSLQTGRTHQIRVHAKYLNHSIVGDALYGTKVNGLQGQLLHAYKISFIHPTTLERMTFEAKMPDYFENYLNKQKEMIF